jgi:glutamate-1-semialdehyde aminotransferase
MPNHVGPNRDLPSIEISQSLLQRAERLIPGATQTLAKGPSQYVRGVAPAYLSRGEGARVWDVDGNEYIDCNMAIGPLSLGYTYGRVDEAIRQQLQNGITFSLMHPLEVEVAETIQRIIPGAERVRFSKTGADVTSAAVRLARAFTGRKKIACCGYHGWHDWYVGTTPRSHGVPDEVRGLTRTFDYNDADSAACAVDADTACVILEPTLFEAPRDGFLLSVREICNERGALLIFDEMWTGFRLSLGGAQEFFDVSADLAVFSKAIANGMPLSCLTGRAEILELLDEEVFFYTTFGGEALSLAAAQATLAELEEKEVPSYLHKLGDRLRDGYNHIAEELGMDYTRAVGYGPRHLVTFAARAGNPLEMKSLLQQELIRRGVLWSGLHVLSFSHTDEDIDYLLGAHREALTILRDAVEGRIVAGMLEGLPVEPVFRTTSGRK